MLVNEEKKKNKRRNCFTASSLYLIINFLLLLVEQWSLNTVCRYWYLFNSKLNSVTKNDEVKKIYTLTNKIGVQNNYCYFK